MASEGPNHVQLHPGLGHGNGFHPMGRKSGLGLQQKLCTKSLEPWLNGKIWNSLKFHEAFGFLLGHGVSV